MGVLRVERDAPTGIAARVGGVAWRDFDLQLFVYAGHRRDQRRDQGNPPLLSSTEVQCSPRRSWCSLEACRP